MGEGAGAIWWVCGVKRMWKAFGNGGEDVIGIAREAVGKDA